MKTRGNLILLAKVLVLGLLIAVLSYLFHPEIGHFSLIVDGKPIAEPLARFAAFPTFLAIIALTAIFTLLIFLGIGFFILLGGIVLSVALLFIFAPYLWPVLLAVLIVIAVMSWSHNGKPRSSK